MNETTKFFSLSMACADLALKSVFFSGWTLAPSALSFLGQ
jgi:hypothetical protein